VRERRLAAGGGAAPLTDAALFGKCARSYEARHYPSESPYLIESIRVDASAYAEFVGYNSGGYSSGSGFGVQGGLLGRGSLYHPVGRYVVRLGNGLACGWETGVTGRGSAVPTGLMYCILPHTQR
jgi:hypothetical protein